jgi:hypothetical protein
VARRHDEQQQQDTDRRCSAHNRREHKKSVKDETECRKKDASRCAKSGQEADALAGDDTAAAQQEAKNREYGDGDYGDEVRPPLISARNVLIFPDEFTEPPPPFRGVGRQQPYAKKEKQRCRGSKAKRAMAASKIEDRIT